MRCSLFFGLALCLAASGSAIAETEGWLEWRGPRQNGSSSETGITEDCRPEKALWSVALPGRGTPVVAGDRLYVVGYKGEGFELREVLACFDAGTGKQLWIREFADFLSDIIYRRYSIGAPAIDAETGNIYLHTSPGLLICLDSSGKTLWQRSLMEEFGRLTFPNGRTGCPSLDGPYVYVSAITSNWGRQGPARSRFYAFDKRSGKVAWASTPGTGPKDSSFSTPVFEWRDGRRVFYAGTGCGHVVAVNALSGKPLWRYRMSFGGVNSSVVLAGDRLIAIHGKENLDDTTVGRMVAVKLGAAPGPGKPSPTVLDKGSELWRNPLGMFTSSPVIVGKRVYQMTAKGELCSVDVDSGKVLWKKKLANSQLHASPLAVDGKLYIPLWKGELAIVRPKDSGPEIIQQAKLEGQAIGSPSLWRGRLYVHTTKRLYCFGPKTPGPKPAPLPKAVAPKAGPPVRLQPLPSEVLLRPGESVGFSLKGLDAKGRTAQLPNGVPTWKAFIPPSAKVKAKLDAGFVAGRLTAGPKAKASAGAFQASLGPLRGTIRGRVLPALPYMEDFEGFKLRVPHKSEGIKFAFPPLPWIGARFKWEIRDLDGAKVLTKTLDRILFQRSMTFFGGPDMSGYTLAADLRSDGNRRLMSNVGVINQRYIIYLEGNWQQIQVVSNHDRFKVKVPFKWKPKTWIRLETRVDNQKDGSTRIRARAWKRGGKAPDKWQLDTIHKLGHKNGAPGLYGFSPQSRHRVYIDNISLTKNP